MVIYNVIAKNVENTFEIAGLFAKKFLLIENNDFKPVILYLVGDLGVGKTTFMKGLLTSLGFDGAVKSPTYTIVETYAQLIRPIYHFDLYRLNTPEELELIGIRDYLQAGVICCFEWPSKGAGYIPNANFVINIEIIQENHRKITIDQVNFN